MTLQYRALGIFAFSGLTSSSSDHNRNALMVAVNADEIAGSTSILQFRHRKQRRIFFSKKPHIRFYLEPKFVGLKKP